MEIPVFRKIVKRDDFQRIMASLHLYTKYNPDVALANLLWYSRQVLKYFENNAATVAVLVGVSFLDDNTIRCKGRIGTQEFMKSKSVFHNIGLSSDEQKRNSPPAYDAEVLVCAFAGDRGFYVKESMRSIFNNC